MNLRELGIEWVHPDNGLTLWMHPSLYFGKRAVVDALLDDVLPYDNKVAETNNHTVNNWRAAFLFAEAFVVDYECNQSDIPFVQYLKARKKYDVLHNFDIFMNLTFEDVRFIFDAYSETRPPKNEITSVDGDDEEAKKKPSD
jgi:hypothetical protein